MDLKLTHRVISFTSLLCLVTQLFFTSQLAAQENDTPKINGQWSSVSTWPVLPVHAIVSSSGELLTFGAVPGGAADGEGGKDYDVWNPFTNSHNTVAQTGHDYFCAANVTLPGSGNVLIAGGDDFQTGVSANDFLSLYDPSTQTLSSGDSMESQRWYPTATVLSNGEVLVTGGTYDYSTHATTPEIYNEDTGWRPLTGADSTTLFGQEGGYFYPRVWAAPNGKAFGIAQDRMFWLDPNANNGTGSIEFISQLPDEYPSRVTSSAVMFETGKILQIGGGVRNTTGGRDALNSAIVIDINGNTPVVTQVSSMNYQRHWGNATVLPNGKVLVNGGSTVNNKYEGVAYTSEIWDPATDTWTQVDAEEKPRLYHSSAVLLPDGRIFSGGGGNPGPEIQHNAQFYTPPYLFDSNGNLATRPEIEWVQDAAGYNTGLTTVVTAGQNITRVTLVRSSSTTHSFNMDQRFIELSFTQSNQTLTIDTPASNLVAPPGFYLLSVINDQGVVSESSILKLGGFNVVPPTDSDNDGTPDSDDPFPLDPDNDIDTDGISGHIDNCPTDSNPGQTDSNNNGIGDACDPTIPNTVEYTPTGVEFNISTLQRVGRIGDNWCQTWAADDTVITAMDDGDWTGTTGPPVYHSRLYRISGEADSFTKEDIPGYPLFHRDGDGWFAYGVNAVNGVLYSLVSKTQGQNWSVGPFRGMKLLRSYDNGASWYRVNQYDEDRYLSPTDSASQLLSDEEMFFFEEYGEAGNGKTGYPFSTAAFVQNGKDHSASQDGYVYVYSPEGASSHELSLARVPEQQVGLRSAWQYFSGWNNGTAQWSSDIETRQPNLTLPEQNSSGEYFGWYSWLPSVVWNPGLQLYVMANGGTYAGNSLTNSTEDYYDDWMHTKTGSLGLWYSENPYGPWTQFFYDEEWTVDSFDNRTYQPKLSPKWISPDGQKMTLIWSDAMSNAQGNSHSVHYKWNQMEIDILVDEIPTIDDVHPTVNIDTPTPNQMLLTSTSPVTISGTAADNNAIDRNKLLIFNKSNGQYWNGSTWTTDWAWFEPIGVSSWTYSVALPVGDFSTTAWTWDTANNISDKKTIQFSVENPETTPPTITINPIDLLAPGTVTLSGTSEDNVSIDRNKLLIRDNSTGQHWNGTAWTSNWAWFDSTGTNTWSYSLELPAGEYAAIAWAWDSSNNRTRSETMTFTLASDTTTPIITVNPLNPSVAPELTTISGTASDNVAVTRIQLLIKNKSTGLFWNGSSWTNTWAWFEPNGTENWSYDITLPTGNFAAIAWAWDSTDNRGRSATTSFSVETPAAPDTTSPIVNINPFTSNNVPGLITIAGTATDDGAITRAQLLIKNTGTGEYWNGSSWTNTWAWFEPSGTENWSYNITLPAGDFAAITWAWDSADNRGRSATKSFSVETPAPADTTSPIVNITPFTSNNVPGLITIAGTATDDGAITRNQLLIKNTGTGEYWNGSSWISNWAWFEPSGTDNWSYNIILPAGDYAAIAWAWDSADNHGHSATTSFSVETPAVPDTTSPIVNITPFTSDHVPGLITIVGTATDEGTITRNQLLIKNTGTGKYWNGSSWINTWAWFEPNGSENWSYQITLTAGKYSVIAWAWDASNNYGISTAKTYNISTTP